MKKQIIFTAFGVMLLASCADTWDRVYENGNPQKEGYEYLAEYAPLKEYVDRSKYPDFKVGLALAAADYNKQELVYALANSNFDEVVAGNAMKMASCVDDKGNMSFEKVVSFVDAATGSGLNVYGHTLAWHSQQPIKYLTTLLADKKIEVDPDAKEEKEDYNWDYSTITACPGWNGSPATVNFSWGTPDGLKIVNPAPTPNFYELQYHAANNITLVPGTSYTVRMTLKAEGDAPLKLRFKFGDWGGGSTGEFDVENNSDFQTFEAKFTAADIANQFLLLQHGDFVGTLTIKNITVSHMEALAVEIPETVYSCTFDDGNNLGGWGGSSTREVVKAGHDGGLCHVIHNPAAGNSWEVQAAIDFDSPLEEGETYYLRYWGKSDNGGNIEPAYQNPSDYSGRGAYSSLKMTNEWTMYEGKTVITGADCKRLCFSVGTIAGDIYIDDVEIWRMKSASSIPLTPEEKKDTLTWAMDKWIGGMMAACDSKVKAWDVVNEAISGGNPDSEGVFALQHSEGYTPGGTWDVGGDAFYWQDYLGDIDYVRTAVALARKHYEANGGTPADLKLFVNDYNLESDWDDNGKVKSLIKWIERWEADGVTKIDGIGTQMHISCYMNPQTQESKKKHITKMFELIAASGKLCRVSELDMGLVDAAGNSVKTADVTEEQHKAMAEMYKFVVSEYLRIIPAAQQWGICQWCATDSPAGSGWRAGEPVGLWDSNYYRKHTYAGFADGLSGK